MEAYGLEVEEELSTLATQFWAEGVWTGEWHHEQREAWVRKIREVQMWRQERGPAGAVMCETLDLGNKWPHCNTLTFQGDRNVDLRDVCPKDVKIMLLQQARTVYWKKWAAKHEYEELMGIWLEPAVALLRKKTKEECTEKHRNVARKLVLEGGWVQNRLFDIGWSDKSSCQACHKEEGAETHRIYHFQEWHEVRRGFQMLLKVGAKEARVSFVCLFCSVSQCRRLIPCTSHCGSSVSNVCLIHHVSFTR